MDAVIGFAAFLLCCFLAASTGAAFRPDAWYHALAKPAWRPPDWLFAPVWTVLYILIATSGWHVWRSGHPDTIPALAAFALNLALNAAWSPIFFGLRRIDLALVEIVALWGSTLALVILFTGVSSTAGALMAPYLVWVSFAAVLNAQIWRMNRAPAGAR